MPDAPKTKRAKATKPTKVRKARAVDPEYERQRLEIEIEHKASVNRLKAGRKSARTLNTIIGKFLPNLTDEDRDKLGDTLRGATTPLLGETLTDTQEQERMVGGHA